MKRFCLLFVLFGALVGCYGPTMKVRVSDGRSDYSIYCNGVQVCDRSDSCEFPTLWSDEVFYLQVRRNNVIYGGLNIYREDGTAQPQRRADYVMRHTYASGDLLATTKDVFTLSLLLSTPSKTPGYFPAEVVLSVGPKDSLQANYPWDKPIK